MNKEEYLNKIDHEQYRLRAFQKAIDAVVSLSDELERTKIELEKTKTELERMKEKLRTIGGNNYLEEDNGNN